MMVSKNKGASSHHYDLDEDANVELLKKMDEVEA